MGVEPVDGACGANFLMPFEPPLELIGDAAAKCRIVGVLLRRTAPPRRRCRAPGRSPRRLADRFGRRGAPRRGGGVPTTSSRRGPRRAGTSGAATHSTGRSPRRSRPWIVPVVAAGGIVTSERVAELLREGRRRCPGRDAIPLPCPESGAHPDYVTATSSPHGEGDTELTTWFGEGLGRARLTESSARRSRPRREERLALGRGHPLETPNATSHDMALYAGVGAGDVDEVEPASRCRRRPRTTALSGNSTHSGVAGDQNPRRRRWDRSSVNHHRRKSDT